MNWQEVCEHPSLKDLPFKIELEKKWRKKGNYILQPGQKKCGCAMKTAS